jgi:hypothetical protein
LSEADDDGGRRGDAAVAEEENDKKNKEPERRRIGVPKYYYWAKSPPKPTPYQPRRFVNGEQRKLYWVMTAFNLAKVAAIVTVFLLMFGRI